MARSTSRIGSAGVFHTAAQLAQRGWDASLTLGNAPRTDILAQHGENQRSIAVQCKASTGNQGFLLSKGCEGTSPPGRDEWFALITLWDAPKRPDFYVIPRDVVAAYIYVAHRAWLRGRKADGSARMDGDTRNLELGVAQPYRERWDLLARPASDVPYWLPEWIFAWAEHTGLPAGHPGLTRPDIDDEDALGLEPFGWLPELPGVPAP